MEGPSGIVQQQDTLNRYLLYFTRGKSVLPDVHSFTGEEELSKPYRYTIRFPNLRQRVFCQHRWVGRMETEPFKMAPERKGDFSTTPVMNAGYSYSDVVINGEELPEPFIFKLMGQDNHPDNDPKTSDKPYTAYIDPNSPDAYISYSAKASAISRTASATYALDNYQRITWQPGHVLTPNELQVESFDRGHEVIRGEVTGMPLIMTMLFPLLL